MEIDELCRALRKLRIETGSFACFGCGYEHGCRVHGCTLIRQAVDRLEQLNDFERSQSAKLLARVSELEEGQRWRSPQEELPPEDEMVLVIANGKIAENVTAVDAVMLARWAREDGWMLELYPQTETGFEIRFWMPLPNLKGDEKIEGNGNPGNYFARSDDAGEPDTLGAAADCLHWNVHSR